MKMVAAERGSVTVIAVAVLLGGLGVALISVSQQAALKDQGVRNWREALATITEASKPAEGTQPVIRYEYSVENQNYVSEKLLWGTGQHQDTYVIPGGVEIVMADPSGKLVARKFVKGDRVPVSYRPDQPAESVMVVYEGTPKQQAGLFAIGVVCVLAALLLVGRTVS